MSASCAPSKLPLPRVRLLVTLGILVSVSLSLLLATGPPGAGATQDRWQDIARKWAPYIYQDVHEADADADFITDVNFDDDNFDASNNWHNQADTKYELKPVVYFWVVETGSHWYIGYALYHPRDWGEYVLVDKICTEDNPGFGDPSFGCHENDMEGLLVVVRRGGGLNGTPELMTTIHHSDLSCYFAEGKDRAAIRCKNVGPLKVRDGRLVAYSEALTHAIYGHYDWDDAGFLGGNGLVYYPDGAMPPSAGFASRADPHKSCAPLVPGGSPEAAPQNDRENCEPKSYKLKEISELWDKRCRARLFALAGKFNGDDYQDYAASPPWAWSNGPFRAPAFFDDPAPVVEASFNLGLPFDVEVSDSSFERPEERDNCTNAPRVVDWIDRGTWAGIGLVSGAIAVLALFGAIRLFRVVHAWLGRRGEDRR